MRRTAIAIAALLAVGLVVVATQGSSGGDDRYRVAAIFDTAKGMDPTQLVKIAGARVGTVEDVQLIPGPKARLVLSIDREFGPFGKDASCQILPEGLISEYFVQCDPGSRGAGTLPERDGVPTVPLSRTQVPVSLQQVLNVFSKPVDKRIQVFVNELGMATAGRGEDIDALVRRANPALGQTQRVLSILNRQRRELVDGITQTDRVLSGLAAKDDAVQKFVARSADVVSETADHRKPLSEAIRRLPALLDAVKPSMASIDRTMVAATPLLTAVDAAAPSLNRLNVTLPRFAKQGVPAVGALGEASATGRDVIPPLKPVVSNLRKATTALRPFARHLDRFIVHFRDNGGSEKLIDTFYGLATLAGGYDGVSHVVSIIASVYARCIADHKARGCSHAYSAPGMGRIPVNTVPDAPFRGRARKAPKRPARRPDKPATRPADPAPANPAPARDIPGPVSSVLDTLDELLPGVGLSPKVAPPAGSGDKADNGTVLLDFLLKP